MVLINYPGFCTFRLYFLPRDLLSYKNYAQSPQLSPHRLCRLQCLLGSLQPGSPSLCPPKALQGQRHVPMSCAEAEVLSPYGRPARLLQAPPWGCPALLPPLCP